MTAAVRKPFILASLVLAVAMFAALGASSASGQGEALPGQGFLPDGRAWEMVSPPDKNGSDVMADSRRARVAADGDAVGFASLGFFAGGEGGGIARDYLSVRSAEAAPGGNGWATHGIAAPQPAIGIGPLAATFDPRFTGEMSPDLDSGVYFAVGPLTADPAVANVVNLYRRTGLLTPGGGADDLVSGCPLCVSTGTPLPPLPSHPFFASRGNAVHAGSSPSLDHVIFESRQRLTDDLPALTPLTNRTRLYEWHDGVTRLAGRVPVAPATSCDDVGGPACEAADVSIAGQGAGASHVTLATPHTVSDGSDGHSRVLFTRPTFNGTNVSPSALVGQLFMRTDGVSTVQLNAVESSGPAPDFAPATYLDASADGRRVFFMSDQPLTDSAALSGGTRIYMYDVDPDSEVQTVTVNASGGQFTLTFDGQTTNDIPFDASEDTIRDELNALSTIGAAGGEVTVTRSDTVLTVAFAGALANTPLPELTTADGTTPLEGGSATVATVNDGGHLTILNVDSEPADGTGNGRNFIGASDDGRYAYFMATSQLVAGGPIGVGEEMGVYLWRDGELTYIAPLPNTGVMNENIPAANFITQPRQARVAPDGRHVVFSTIKGEGVLSSRGGDDYDHGGCVGGAGCRELYVYSADDDTLECASCRPSGKPATAMATNVVRYQYAAAQTTWHETNALSDDGRYVFFSSAEKLVAGDANSPCEAPAFGSEADCTDAYVYDTIDEEVSLLSSGEGSAPSFFMDASPDGRDAFFVTSERLSGWDVDGARDLYDARVGGGFPEPEPGEQGCVGDGCQDEPANGTPKAQLVPSQVGGQSDPAPHVRSKPKSCARLSRNARRAQRNARVLRKRAARAQGERALQLQRKARRATRSARRSVRAAQECRAEAAQARTERGSK